MEKNITLESTLKSNDTEEWWDLVFTRPLGFKLAKIYRKARISPNQVTTVSIILGMSAGYCFYFTEMRINIIGMLLLIIANLHDSADGQLARMTNNKTQLGRILDGLAGDLWFITIYIAICLRLTHAGYPTIWILASISGVCHILQAAMSDYYRNVHLLFTMGKESSEVDNSLDLKKKFSSLHWRTDFFHKITLLSYLNYTKTQEQVSTNLQKLLYIIRKKYNNSVPLWLSNEFREKDKPLMKYTNILTFNTRMFILFFSIIICEPWIYFLFEISIMNIIFIQLIVRQEKISLYFVKKLECRK